MKVMERLTDKEMCNFTNMEFQVKQIDWHSIYNKLAEFEDFMEEQGIEGVEQLKETIEIFKTARRLCFGISARRNGKSLMLMNELIDLCKYKNNWHKLKELIKKDIKHNEKEFNESYIYAFEHYSTVENWVLDRMQELENGEK